MIKYYLSHKILFFLEILYIYLHAFTSLKQYYKSNVIFKQMEKIKIELQ